MTMQEKTNFWQNCLKDWSESNQDIETFCQERNMEAKQFRYWKRKLMSEQSKESSQAFVEWIPNSDSQTFNNGKGTNDNRIMIYYQGMKLYIPDGFHEDTLTHLLKVLKQV